MLTLRSIIQNISKGQSALNVRSILSQLDQTYMTLARNISITGCQKHSDSATTVFLSIPSLSTRSVRYDVVLWVKSTKKMKLDTEFKAYSNSPAFAYNFVYVFNKAGSLLFPEKYPAKFRNQPPKVRNPYMSTGFDKLVFSGIKYISEYKLPRIIGEYNGTVPSVKSFNEKIREVKDVKDEIRRSQIRI